MDTAKLTETLQARQQEIETQMESLVTGAAVSTAGGISFGKRVGEGTAIAVERMTEVNLHSGLQAELETVTTALTKLEDGTYGTCEICGEPISEARLSALPWAIGCIDCS